MKNSQRGFTLVEMAIVLVIVGLLVGGLITPLSLQMEQRRIGDTQKILDEGREALLGFALRNGYLPCPAISASNGLEDRDGAGCSNNKRSGYLPWATLGLPKLDAWNHLFHYSVTPAFANAGTPFRLNTARDISIATRGPNGALTAATEPNDIPAIILSLGKNGYGGTGEQGNSIADAGSGNIDEKFNLGSSGTAYIARTAGDSNAVAGGPFDDMLVWLSPNILYNRMVSAQKLP